tara:strand:- start:21370 stop:23061 length:1692 start_codon:yes stop_codon:yes gene_type:complete
MNYGFVIDNRKCIGCHACTVACKSEHDVPIGVNRTFVKQVEKGVFPDTQRMFSVLRCNHCEDAPCVTICPVTALYTREDGIVDFNNNRCIGCKSCMQACPYDALYIDPETSTAAKCNYCAHRVDIGLEPACVNICPEEAIISGDLDNPASKIAKTLGRHQVTVRKPEKNTKPNLYYIDGDLSSLTASETVKGDSTLWSSQSRGVGHYAKYAEKQASKNSQIDYDAVNLQGMLKEKVGDTVATWSNGEGESCASGSCGTDNHLDKALKNNDARRVYDTPDKGILWGWEVSGYVLTKAISAGVFLLLVIGYFLNSAFNQPFMTIRIEAVWTAIIIGLTFLGATGALLVMDLDQPKRFLYVLLRPQWDSWLVKGGYSISIYGALISFFGLAVYMEWKMVAEITVYLTAFFAVIVAIYTAFLFAQAKGRDFWQSPTLVFHMLIHSFMAGAATYMMVDAFIEIGISWNYFVEMVMKIAIIANLFVVLIELTITHPTTDAKKVAHDIVSGRYKQLFWFGTILMGNVIPFLIVLFIESTLMMGIAGLLVLAGIFVTEKIWIEAPQRIVLT